MKRFLIVDDDELSCNVLKDFLSEFADCDIASNGRIGYELYEKAIVEGRPYDLICSDVIMPDLDGHGMVRMIRAREESHSVADSKRSKIFMISVSDTPEEMTHAFLDNKCNDYIVKPFQREKLKALLQKYDLNGHINEP